jgi:DNA repair protein RadC
VLSFNLISEGVVNATPLNIRTIMEISLKYNASQLILVHNHPSGIVAPSRNDIDATMGIQDLMRKMGMKLSDHIIIGHGDDYFSFRKSDKWKYIF